MYSRATVLKARADYLRKHAKAVALRTRLIARRKSGKKYRVFQESYHRAKNRSIKAKRVYLRIKAAYTAQKRMTVREKAVAWARAQIGTTEATGNNDGPKILSWQRHTARGETYLDRAPYCGIGCENACSKAGVKTSSRWASVAFIEDDARAGTNGFRGWTTDKGRVLRGDLVVLFGRGVHVEIVTSVSGNVVNTIGFNTSPGTSGSQSNGGGVYARQRPMSDVRGFALVDYPN